MLNGWYSEFSNFAMANDTCSYANLRNSFPFSSVKLMDYASSLPEKWKKDKIIQKDMCRAFLNMPEQVAYRVKDHSRELPYDKLVYPFMYGEERKNIVEFINSHDFGPLNENLKNWVKKDCSGRPFFAIYGIALQMDEYGLRIE